MANELSPNWWQKYQSVLSSPRAKEFIDNVYDSPIWESILSKPANQAYTEAESNELLKFYFIMQLVPPTDRVVRIYANIRLDQIEPNYPQLGSMLRNKDPILDKKTTFSSTNFVIWHTQPPLSERNTVPVVWDMPISLPIVARRDRTSGNYIIGTWPNIRFDAVIDTRTDPSMRLQFSGFTYSAPQTFFFSQLSQNVRQQYFRNFVFDQTRYYLRRNTGYALIMRQDSKTIVVVNDDMGIAIESNPIITFWTSVDQKLIKVSNLETELASWTSIPDNVRVHTELVRTLRALSPELLREVNSYKVGHWYQLPSSDLRYIGPQFMNELLNATTPIYINFSGSDQLSRINPSIEFPNAIQSSNQNLNITQDVNLFHRWQNEMIMQLETPDITAVSSNVDGVIEANRLVICPCPNQYQSVKFGIYDLTGYSQVRYNPSSNYLVGNRELAQKIMDVVRNHFNHGVNLYRYFIRNMILANSNVYFLNSGPGYNPNSKKIMMLSVQDIKDGVHPRVNNMWTATRQLGNMLSEILGDTEVNQMQDIYLITERQFRSDEVNRARQALVLLSNSLFAQQELDVSLPSSNENIYDVLNEFYDQARKLLNVESVGSNKDVDKIVTDNITKLEVFNLVFQYTPRVSQAWTGLVTRMADSFDQAVQRIKIERMTVIVQGGSSQPLLTTNERRAGEAARMASSTSTVPASSTSTVPASSTSTVPAQQSRELTPAGLAALRRAEANQMWPQEINLESGSFPSTVPATSSSSSVGGDPYTFTFPR